MTIADWLMIMAVLLGSIIAVQLARYLDNKKEERDCTLQFFKTLWQPVSTRYLMYPITLVVIPKE
ncbi:MAG: DUF6680 family protein [Methylobacter sp.]|jgi:hypothetical protein